MLSIENSWKITGNEIMWCGAFLERDLVADVIYGVYVENDMQASKQGENCVHFIIFLLCCLQYYICS